MNEATTEGDIVYLPSGFVSMRRHLATLAAMKPRWKIEVLENTATSYRVNFEDKLSVKVRHRHMNHFMEHVLGVQTPVITPVLEVDLAGSIVEARDADEIFTDSVRDFGKALHGRLKKAPYAEAFAQANAFRSAFQGSRAETPDSVMLSVDNPSGQMPGVLNKIHQAFQNDLGGLQELTATLKGGGPLVGEDVFKNYDSILGTVMTASYQGTPLRLEMGVMMSGVPYARLEVDNDQAMDDLDGTKGVKIAKNVAYPTSGKFLPNGFFKKVKDAIDDSTVEKSQGE